MLKSYDLYRDRKSYDLYRDWKTVVELRSVPWQEELRSVPWLKDCWRVTICTVTGRATICTVTERLLKSYDLYRDRKSYDLQRDSKSYDLLRDRKNVEELRSASWQKERWRVTIYIVTERTLKSYDLHRDSKNVEELRWHCWELFISIPPRWPCGKESASRTANLGLIPAFAVDTFPGWVMPVATPSGARRYRVSAGTGRLGVSILWLGEKARLICNFYLSVAARTIVWIDPSVRYTSMLLGRSATT